MHKNMNQAVWHLIATLAGLLLGTLALLIIIRKPATPAAPVLTITLANTEVDGTYEQSRTVFTNRQTGTVMTNNGTRWQIKRGTNVLYQTPVSWVTAINDYIIFISGEHNTMICDGGVIIGYGITVTNDMEFAFGGWPIAYEDTKRSPVYRVQMTMEEGKMLYSLMQRAKKD